MNAFAHLDTRPLPPARVVRPALALWLWERDLDLRAAGRLFGVSHEAVRGWTLPFDHPDRVEPRAAAAGRIATITGLPPESFRPPGDAAGAGG